MRPDEHGYDARVEHDTIRDAMPDRELDWMAVGRARVVAFAARQPDAITARAATRQYALGMLAQPILEDPDVTDAQLGQLTRGVIHALVNLGMVGGPSLTDGAP